MNILIADDHPILREGLKLILAEAFSTAVFGEARDAAEVLAQVQKRHWDVLLLDITMPGRSGLDVLRELKYAYPNLPVLVLSMHPEDQYAVRVLKTGAAGYMTKEAAPEELIRAIKRVRAGGKYISPSVAEKLAFDLERGSERPPHEALSNREYEVMREIASGKTVTQIAREWSLSVKTISTYRARILRKMNMKTNAELTHYAVKNRLVE